MTTVMLRDGVFCNTKCEEHVARQIRLHDTYGAKLMMDPGLVAEAQLEDPPQPVEPPRPIPMTARKIRDKIVSEMGNDFAGKPPPDLPHMPGEMRDATQAYTLDTGVRIPAASPGSGGALTSSHIYDQQVIYAIAYAVAARFEAKRREAEKRKAEAEVEDMPAGEKKRWKKQYPEAADRATRLRDLQEEREREKRHDRRGERYALSPVVSPEPVSTAARAAGTPAPPATATITHATPSAAASAPPMPAPNPANMDHWIATASPQEIAALRAKLDQSAATPASAPSHKSRASHTSSSRKQRHEQAASDVTGTFSKRNAPTRARERQTTRDQVRLDRISDDNAVSAPDPASGLAADDASPPPLE